MPEENKAGKTINKVDYTYLTIIILYFIIFYSFNYNVGTIQNVDESYFLNAFHRIYLGQMPYRDFTWVYGPSMLYFFSTLFKVFSVSAITARIGYIVLYFFVVILTYFLARKIMPRFFALISSIFLIGILKVFYAMYTHIGCTLAGLLILFFILTYVETNKPKYLFWAGIFCGFSLTVKMNIGLAMLVSVCVFFVVNYLLECVTDNKKIELFNKNLMGAILIYLGMALVISAPICFYFFKSLTPEQMATAFPWYSIFQYSDRGQCILPVSFTISSFRNWFGGEPLVPLLIRILPVYFAAVLLYKTYLKKITFFEKAILLLMIFMVSISVENFVYGGKIQYAQPVIYINFACLLFLIRKSLKNKVLIYSFWCIFSIFLFIYVYTYSLMPIVKKNIMFGKYFALKRAHIYVPDNNTYYNFLNTISFIQKNTSPNDKIVALPFEPFIYFYGERQNATRTDVIEYRIIYNETAEKMVIDGIKKNKPKFIIISNLISAEESQGLRWGETYEKNVKKYIFDNYHFKTQFGDFKARNMKELSENYSCKVYEINGLK